MNSRILAAAVSAVLAFAAAEAGATPNTNPTYLGQFSQNTHSHGGGYDFAADEILYPDWGTNTIYRYHPTTRAFQGTTTLTNGSGTGIMQIVRGADGTVYTADWGIAQIRSYSGYGGALNWSYSLSNLGAGVWLDSGVLYAHTWANNVIRKLNPSTGADLGTVTLSGWDGLTYGGAFVVLDDYAFVGDVNGSALRVFSLTTGTLVNSLAQYVPAYNGAYNGRGEFCVSPNSSTVTCFDIGTSDDQIGQVPGPAPLGLLGAAMLAFAGLRRIRRTAG